MRQKIIAIFFLLFINLVFCQTYEELSIVKKLDSLTNAFRVNKNYQSLSAFVDYLDFNVENASISLAEIERQIEIFRLLHNEQKYTMMACRIDFIEAIVYKKTKNYTLFENKMDAIKEKLKLNTFEASLLERFQFNYYLASHLFNNKEIEKAKEILLENETLILNNPDHFQKTTIYETYSNSNTLGLIYTQEKNYLLADKYLNLALDRATIADNKGWIGLISGNYGYLKNQMQDYESATKLFLTDIKFSSQNNLISSTIGACIGLSKNYLALQKTELANIYADSARYYFLINNDEKINLNRVSYKFYQDFYSIKGAVYNNLLQKDSSNYYLQLLSDTLSSQITRLNLENEINQKKRYEIEFETAKSISLKKENTQNKFLFLLVLLVLILMILFTFFQWNHNRNLKKQQVQILAQKKQLEKINSQKNLFLGILSHDIRGPIINLKELLNLNRNHIIDDQEFLTYKNKIGLSIEGLSSTLENLLNWVKNNFDNEVKVNLKSHSLSNLITKVQLEVISQLLNKNINLAIQNPDAKQLIFCDEDLFSIVLRNLINNAMKYSSEESTIRISISKAKNNRVQISIIDEGVGMTEAQIEHLFTKSDQYQNQSAKGTEGEKGFGLGLQICFDFLQKMNGSIRVESEKNVGSTFIVELPEKE